MCVLRTLPRSLISGVAITIIIYTFTNVSYLTVMSRAELLAADAVAVVRSYLFALSACMFVCLPVSPLACMLT